MNYHNITYPDMNNGDGLRVVLWLSGCNHHCFKCQNPQTWDKNSGILFDEKAKEELFSELDKDYISGLTLSGGDPLHEANMDGVLDIVTKFKNRYKTNQDIVYGEKENHNMLNEKHDEIRLSLSQKKIWLYTGFTWEQIMHPVVTDDFNFKRDEMIHKRKEIVSLCDVLVEGRYVDELRDLTLKWRGSSNQRVIDVQKTLEENKITLHCD